MSHVWILLKDLCMAHFLGIFLKESLPFYIEIYGHEVSVLGTWLAITIILDVEKILRKKRILSFYVWKILQAWLAIRAWDTYIEFLAAKAAGSAIWSTLISLCSLSGKSRSVYFIGTDFICIPCPSARTRQKGREFYEISQNTNNWKRLLHLLLRWWHKINSRSGRRRSYTNDSESTLFTGRFWGLL